MKIICTSDWHLGNLFHSIDRLPEHRHFLDWLRGEIAARQPDVLLVAGDVFDNGNPSAAAQSAYYEFLATVTAECPDLHVVIIAGNHDSASRLEAPRPLLLLHKIEIRGAVRRTWRAATDDEAGRWETRLDDMIIPVTSRDGKTAVILAVPYLRSDIVADGSYSRGVNRLLHALTERARAVHPGLPVVMMAHLYASGAEVSALSSERIVVGGQERVDLERWEGHPDFLVCGHIHKRQPIWGTDWARYCGNVLPMSFAETEYRHGVDCLTLSPAQRPVVEFVEYHPLHPLRSLPADGAAEMKELLALIDTLPDREEGRLSPCAAYVELKLLSSKVRPEDRAKIEEAVERKDAVVCRIQQVLPSIGVNALSDDTTFRSIDDILNRPPQDAVRECFVVKHRRELNEHQRQWIEDIVQKVHTADTQTSTTYETTET